MSDDALRYPLGRFEPPADVTDAHIEHWISDIAALPSRLREAVESLNDEQLETAYRPGGWTLRQVVHHLGDSHLNAFTRFKLTLTEDTPRIKPYDEAAWAELPDSRTVPVQTSLAFIEALHARWVALMQGMTPAQWDRAFDHPEGGTHPLRTMVGMYAWHGNHHLAHITQTIQQEDW